MKFNYQNRQGGFQLLPERDYQVEITAVETKISTGGKTRGDDMWVLTLRESASGTELEDQIIFNDKCAWKIDVILKSIGRAPSGVGEIDLTPDTFIGGKATVHVVVETYEKKTGPAGNKDGKSNKVAAWLSPAKGGKPVDDFA